jgi:integrase/recombinase XerD
MEVLAKMNTENNTDRVLRYYYTGKIFHIRGKPMTFSTRKDYVRILKSFFRWLHGKNTPLVDDVTVVRKESERYTVIGDIITDADMLIVLGKCESLRDKALLALLHETGARAQELLGLKRKDIFKEGTLTKVRLNGKTGERKIPIVTSVPYLMRYLESHSFDSPDSFIWLSDNGRYKNEPLAYSGFCCLIESNFMKSGLAHKKANPHFFRHSRASINAKFLTDTQMCLFFGWKIGSKQVATYVHASGRDCDDAIQEMYGVQHKEERVILNKPRVCAICKTENEGIADFCKNCGQPLSLKVAMEKGTVIDEETNKAFELLIEISQSPALMKEFEEFKRNFLSQENEKKRIARAQV